VHVNTCFAFGLPRAQEIISIPEWKANNSLAILFVHNDTSRAGVRWLEAFSPTREGVATPALEVTWTPKPVFTGVFSVTGRADSGEEQVTTGMMYLTSSDLELSHDTWLTSHNNSQRG
jgi:hypothetical protein